MRRIFPPSPPNNKTTLAVVLLFVVLVWMRTRISGSLKLPGAIFNARFLCSPVGCYRDVDGRATQGAVAEVKYMDVFHNSRSTMNSKIL